MSIKRPELPVACAALGAFAVASAISTVVLADDNRFQPAHAEHHYSDSDARKPASELVQIIRQATARFRDVRVAEAEKYQLMFGCVTGGDVGAMGLHFVNMDLVMDGKLDATRPEIVIYEPLPDGKLRLIGADFLVLAQAWDDAHKLDGPPQLNGQLFHLFGAPNRFGLPAFYTLHVWAWKDNPSGTFTNWHTKVSCDAFDGEPR